MRLVSRKNKPKKKYEEVVEDISYAIQSGIYPPSSQLPSESSLCQEYEVSRITVRKALSILAAQGLLYSVPGKGRFVKGSTSDDYLLLFDLDNVLTDGYDETRLVESSVILPDADLVYNLYVSPKDQVVVLKWVIISNGKPVALDEKYLPYYPGMNLSESHLMNQDFSDLLKNRASLYDIRQELVVSSTKASIETANRLKIEAGGTLWLLEINIYHKNGNPLGWNRVSVLPEEIVLSGKQTF